MQLVLRARPCLVVLGIHAGVEQVCSVPGTACGGYADQKQHWCLFVGHVFLSVQRELWLGRPRHPLVPCGHVSFLPHLRLSVPTVKGKVRPCSVTTWTLRLPKPGTKITKNAL